MTTMVSIFERSAARDAGHATTLRRPARPTAKHTAQLRWWFQLQKHIDLSPQPVSTVKLAAQHLTLNSSTPSGRAQFLKNVAAPLGLGTSLNWRSCNEILGSRLPCLAHSEVTALDRL